MAKSHPDGSPAEPHTVFLVPELLEMILLHADMRTLLVSCQCVCHFWHNVIKDSTNLQEALFFKPAKQGTADILNRIQNTLLTDVVWPEYLRSNIQPKEHRWPGRWSKKLPKLKPEREEAFTRPEASWRRMLLHQPPHFQLAGLARKEKPITNQILHYTTFDKLVEQQDLVHMEDIRRKMHDGLLVPCETPWTFALTGSCEKVPDVAKLDEMWGMGVFASFSKLFGQYSIIALVWILPPPIPENP